MITVISGEHPEHFRCYVNKYTINEVLGITA